MTKIKILILAICVLFISTEGSAQVLDFENTHLNAGDSVSFFSVDSNCDIVFYTSIDLKKKRPFYLQKVGEQANSAFQGIRGSADCMGKPVPENRFNNMNSKGYKPNPIYTNKQRVGCQFISAKLEGNDIPSVLIEYKQGTYSCSGDILDVDGANNAIEAYDIYYFKELDDFPNSPISEEPIKIRTSGPSFGNGEIGDDGGIEHFEINSNIEFKLVEIRPNQKPNEKNKLRTIFGFALDNFSPCQKETNPFTPPYLKEEKTAPLIIEDVHFGFDKDNLTSKEIDKLNELISVWSKDKSRIISLTAFTDPKGSRKYNLDLSKRRVNAVKEYLIQNGVAQNTIQIEYKGEEYDGKPTDPDWKRRRVRIKLDTTKPKLH